jgi:hypothetical protein
VHLLPTSALVLAVLVGGAAASEPTDVAHLMGGGPRASDCMVVTDVAAPATGLHARAVRCRDGDPRCDADGVADGRCTFRVRLCFAEMLRPSCHADVVVGASLLPAAAALDALATAVADVPMPVTEPSTCTPSVEVLVSPIGHRAGRLAFEPAATMTSGDADRDRVALVCRPAPSRPPATFATLERRVFARSCASLSCHGAAVAGGLDLTPGHAYASLVGVPASNTVAQAAGVLRVAPGDADASFLLRKLEGALGDGEGDPMPQVGTRLPAAKLDLVRRWIAGGAPAASPF